MSQWGSSEVFWFLFGALCFISVTLTPRLIHVVNEVLRPMDKVQ